MPATGAGTCASRCASPTASRGCTPRATGVSSKSARIRRCSRWRSARCPRPDGHFADLAAPRQGRLARADGTAWPTSTCAARRSTGPASTGGPARRAVALPTYPFERRSFWIAAAPPARRRSPLPPRRGRHGSSAHALATARADRSSLGSRRAAGVPRRAPRARRCAGRRAGLPGDGAGRRATTAFGAAPRAIVADFIDPRAAAAARRWPRSCRLQSRRRRRRRRVVLRDPQPRVDDGVTRLAAARQRPAVDGAPGCAEPAAAAPRSPRRSDALGPAVDGEAYYEQPGRARHRRSARASAACSARTSADGEVLARIALPEGAAADAVAGRTRRCSTARCRRSASRCRSDRRRRRCLPADRRRRARTSPAAAAGAVVPCAAARGGPADPSQWRADVMLRGDDGAVLGRIGGVRPAARCRGNRSRRAVGVVAGHGLGYQVVWEPAPLARRAARWCRRRHRSPRCAALQRRWPAPHGLAVYDDLLPELDRLSAEHVAAALRELGFDDTPGRRFERRGRGRGASASCRRTAVCSRGCCEMLAEDGVLRRAGRRLRVRGAARHCRTPTARYDALAGALRRGRWRTVDAAPLRRGAGAGAARRRRIRCSCSSPADRSRRRASSTSSRRIAPHLQRRARRGAVTAAIAALPPAARLRVLEIGAGTGGTTTYVLPLLPGDRVEYTFTDLSPLFLERAAEQFAAYPFMRRALLDIERDPALAGFR